MRKLVVLLFLLLLMAPSVSAAAVSMSGFSSPKEVYSVAGNSVTATSTASLTLEKSGSLEICSEIRIGGAAKDHSTVWKIGTLTLANPSTRTTCSNASNFSPGTYSLEMRTTSTGLDGVASVKYLIRLVPTGSGQATGTSDQDLLSISATYGVEQPLTISTPIGGDSGVSFTTSISAKCTYQGQSGSWTTTGTSHTGPNHGSGLIRCNSKVQQSERSYTAGPTFTSTSSTTTSTVSSSTTTSSTTSTDSSSTSSTAASSSGSSSQTPTFTGSSSSSQSQSGTSSSAPATNEDGTTVINQEITPETQFPDLATPETKQVKKSPGFGVISILAMLGLIVLLRTYAK